MTLPADVTRCIDIGCPKNSRCTRYLDRNTGAHQRTPYISTCRRAGSPVFPFFLDTAGRGTEPK